MPDESPTHSTANSDPAADAQLRELARRLGEGGALARLADVLRSGASVAVDGVFTSARALVAAAFSHALPPPLLIVVPNGEAIDAWVDDLALFASRAIEPFPAMEAFEGERVAHDELFGQRLRLLKSLATDRRPGVVVASIQALLQPVPTAEALAERTMHLATGDARSMDDLAHWLASNGFHATTAVELSNEFARRGGVLDIFAADWDRPVRLEFFGDEIESIRAFDAATQRGVTPLDRIDLTLLSPSDRYDAHLADHLAESAKVVLVEPALLEEEGRRYLERLERPQDIHGVSAVLRRLMDFPAITLTELAEAIVDEAWQPNIESVERFSGPIDKVRKAIDEIEGTENVYLVSQTSAEQQRLREIFGESSIARAGRLHFPTGRLAAGFRLPDEHLIFLSAAQLFGRSDIRRPTRKHLGKAIDSFTELKTGDLVVHLGHGIGRFRGVRLLQKTDMKEEHLEIEFADNAKVFVPSSRIGLVQRYVGGSRARPRLAKIGGQVWAKRKKAVEAAVADLAADMIELQAMRDLRPGIAFPDDTAWQGEFDAAFPYDETEDQLLAINAIREDMTRHRPMDRLICGDVGFGKTELAMRAAFKAVDAGYQVGVLVPTTVLAEQHFRTFRDRMAEFPFEIAVLSRFGTKGEQAKTIERAAEGEIDIVIGTHRLAQRDVRFHNLGLLIIDEEQRFGVEIKERLKSLRHTVDVLTMTATPIPRTLHMSLLGIRDISNLATAPEDRVSVETRVTRFKPDLVRHAILRELNRNGQVYFVHNRVRDIERVKRDLLNIVPEARIEIGHAQMSEHELEDVMLGFVRHEFDVLLSTTIVESGLDIPNANTIFIDDANRFGLSDLHQLRGRVGRYKHQAYCYLLVDPKKPLTPVAARRLHAIEEFSHLGAGFALAMRDLEIRGAGNILGTQQSGHIALVGYELYCQLLDNAVRHLRSLPPSEIVEVDVDLPGEAYFPDEYVADQRMKIDLYRRLARATSEPELDEFRSELLDRFGPLPPPAERMLAVGALRIAAHRHGIGAIRIEESFLIFEFSERKAVEHLMRSHDGRVRLVDGGSACVTIEKNDRHPDRVLELAKSLLRSSE